MISKIRRRDREGLSNTGQSKGTVSSGKGNFPAEEDAPKKYTCKTHLSIGGILLAIRRGGIKYGDEIYHVSH